MIYVRIFVDGLTVEQWVAWVRSNNVSSVDMPLYNMYILANQFRRLFDQNNTDTTYKVEVHITTLLPVLQDPTAGLIRCGLSGRSCKPNSEFTIYTTKNNIPTTGTASYSRDFETSPGLYA